MSKNSFGAASTLKVGDTTYRIFNVSALEASGVANISQMPVSHRILLERLSRYLRAYYKQRLSNTASPFILASSQFEA